MINLIHLKNYKILDQLKLEEFLLKNLNGNFCLINEGTNPAVVLGVSNKVDDLVNIDNAKKDNIPLIKRFTGGGTVFVDQKTVFVSFIFSNNLINIELFPENIIKWAESFYKNVFELKTFNANENDFAINDKKIAGNAKYIKKDRFLLHTSFLFDYDIEKINAYLHFPKKAPKYRDNRSHENFLTPLKNYISKEKFIKNIKDQANEKFGIKNFDHSKIDLSNIAFRTQTINL